MLKIRADEEKTPPKTQGSTREPVDTCLSFDKIKTTVGPHIKIKDISALIWNSFPTVCSKSSDFSRHS